MSKTINKVILNLILLFSIFALFAAYFIQYILGHEPCNLCLIQRIPYILSIVIIIISLIFTKLEKITFIILGIIFFLAALLSIYHVGIERGLFDESSICKISSGLNILDKELLLKELEKNTISCKNVTFTILSLSLATINTFVSLIISLITFWIFYNYEKK